MHELVNKFLNNTQNELFECFSPNNFNLKIFFKIDEIIKFLNGDINFLIIDVNKKFELIYKILQESNSLKKFFENLNKLKIDLNPDLKKEIQYKYKAFKNSKNNKEYWTKNFEWKKYAYLIKLKFLISQIINLQNNNFNSQELVIVGNFLSCSKKDKTQVFILPLIICPINFVLNQNNEISIVKKFVSNSHLNKELLNFEDTVIKKIDDEDFYFSSKYNDIIQKFIKKNKLKKQEKNYYSDYLHLDNNFFITSINKPKPKIEFENDLNLKKIKPFCLNLQEKNLITSPFFNFEKKIYCGSKYQSFYFNSLNFINHLFIENFVFKNVMNKKRTLLFTDNFEVINNFFGNLNLKIKLFILFNFNDKHFNDFYNQIFELENNLKIIENEPDRFNNINYYYNSEDDKDYFDIFENLYNISSIQEQNIDQSLYLINKHAEKYTWAPWSIIAYRYCTSLNIKLSTLLKKVRAIHELNVQYSFFLKNYGYKDFWSNIKKHNEFLLNFDENSLEKTLFYLKKYIENKTLPLKVKFYTIKSEEIPKLIKLYKLFFKASNSELFYIPENYINILLNSENQNYNQFLALCNQKWISENSNFKKFNEMELFFLKYYEKHSSKKFQNNIDSLAKDYYWNLYKKIDSYSDEQTQKLVEMFNFAKKNYKIFPPSLFLKKYYFLLVDIFPFIVWYCESDYVFNNFVFKYKYDDLLWFLNFKNRFLIFDILKNYDNNRFFCLFDIDYLDKNFIEKIKNYQHNFYDINININADNKLIAYLSNPNNYAFNNNALNLNKTIKNIVIKCSNFKNNINWTILEKLVLDLKIIFKKNKNQKFLVVVKNKLIKLFLMRLLLSENFLINAIRDKKLIILQMNDEIDFYIDNLIIVFNDKITIKDQFEFYKSYYNEDNIVINLKKFFQKTNSVVLTYSDFSRNDIELNNKKNQFFLKEMFLIDEENKKNSILKNEKNDLAVIILEDLFLWLKTIINKFKIEIVYEKSINQNLIYISNLKNEIIITIRLIYKQDLNLQENLDLSLLLRKKNYFLIDLFIIEWIFKKNKVKQCLQNIFSEYQIN